MPLTNRHTGEVFELDPHQLEALDWLYTNPRSALFLGMSLQKTVTTLLYLNEMIYAEAAISKALVIAPDKVARLTWPDEVNKWEEVSDIRYSVIAGTAKQRIEALNADADVYFIGVDNLVWLIDLYIKKRTPSAPWSGSLPFDCMVIDELSLFKSQSSNRFKKLRRALGLSNIPYRIGLTGTPSPNGLIDLWAEMFLIDDGERLGQTYGKFVDKYFNTRGNGMIVYEYTPKAGAEKVIAKKIADIALVFGSSVSLLSHNSFNQVISMISSLITPHWCSSMALSSNMRAGDTLTSIIACFALVSGARPSALKSSLIR